MLYAFKVYGAMNCIYYVEKKKDQCDKEILILVWDLQFILKCIFFDNQS